MISRADRFEFTQCDITPTGKKSDAFTVPTLEQWLNINEVVRFLEIAASFTPGNRAARCTLGMGSKDSVSAMAPSRSKLENYVQRINAALATVRLKAPPLYSIPETLKSNDKFAVLTASSAEFPGYSLSEATTAFTRNLTPNGSIDLAPGVAISREDFTTIFSEAQEPVGVCHFDSADSMSSLLYGTPSWERNGLASKSPDEDTGILTPWAKSRDYGVRTHAARFYYHVNYDSDTSYGSADYTYACKLKNPSYQIGTIPFRYSESAARLAYVSCYLIYGCWKASIWECSRSGSSVKFLEYGDYGTFKAVFPRTGNYALMASSIPVTEVYIDPKTVGDYVSGLMNNTAYQPNRIVPKYDSMKRVGWATYVEPLVAIWNGSSQMRYIDAL